MANAGISGEIVRGRSVRAQNTTACIALANIVKSSLGPVGLDKMLVDSVGDVTISNDGATILRQLEVEHPAAKILVELSQLQDQEVGDGTTSVVIIAAELLKVANELVKESVHPTAIISGFHFAKKEACKFIAEQLAIKVESLGSDSISNSARTSMSSKIIGGESDFFSKLAVNAVTAVKTINQKGKIKYPIHAISILKAHGKSIRDSELVNGYALNGTRASQAMPKIIKYAKIALLDFDLRRSRLPLGMQVIVDDPQKLADIRKKEIDITRDRVLSLIKGGANVILTTKGVDDAALKLFVENNCIAVRHANRADLKAIAKATGGQLLLSLADLDGNESVDPSTFGTCELVEETRVGDGELLFFKGCKSSRAQTILLRGANDFMLDEVERSLHDAMCVVKRVLESQSVVPGGGAVEASLSIYLEHVAESLGSREQLAVAAFAQALLVIPKTLAVNGAYDAPDLIAKLRACHNAAQTETDEKIKEENRYMGLDLENGKIRDNLKAGVLEPAISKVKSIRFATEAAITILRIDDCIKMNPAEKPDRPVHDDY